MKLVEGELTKQKVDELTKKWFDIKNNSEMSDVEKRSQYDEVYDAATKIVFDNIKTVKDYDAVKNYMHSAWLKLGFEAGDGNDKSINLAKDLIKRSSISPAAKIVPYIIENYNYVDDYLDDGSDFLEDLKNALVTRTDLWTKYSTEDITKIIGQLHALLKNASSKNDQQDLLDRFKKSDNLRNFLKEKVPKDTSVKVDKVTNNTTKDDLKQTLKTIGLDLDKAEDKKRIRNLLK